MKRVGILTFHHAHNFGAVLQSWALSATIRALGHDVSVINYQPVIGHAGPRTGLRGLIPSPGKLRMDRFLRQHVPVTGPILTSPDSVTAHVDATGYDVLVCGSDQVWMIYDHQGVDRPYFLGVGTRSGLRRISYAPSAGSRHSFGPFAEDVAGLMAEFDAISVRDSNTKAAVAELGITNTTRVQDPTLIADFAPLTPAGARRDEIVVVGKTNAAADRYIRFAAQQLNCKVVAVGARTPAADKQRPYAGPSAWVGSIARARLVVTSLFHGAAVSMALRTPFVALDCGGRAFKLTDLCGYLDIPDQILLAGETGEYEQDPALLTQDYTTLGPRLEAEAARCRAYLDEAIRG